jgi:hypothetical protein
LIVSAVTPFVVAPPLADASTLGVHGGGFRIGIATSPVLVSQLSCHVNLSSVPAALASL